MRQPLISDVVVEDEELEMRSYEEMTFTCEGSWMLMSMLGEDVGVEPLLLM